jgi:lipopolysaccharide exporter
VGIVAAVAGAGVWSLVAATLSQGAVKTLALLSAERRGRRPGWDRTEARSVLAFGTRVTGIGLVQYLTFALPTLVIGRVLGAGPLGQFNRAQLLVNLPLEKVTSSVSRVLFPALASVNTDRARFQTAYELAVRVAALVVVPAIALALMVGDLLVKLLLGPGWEQAATILPVVAAASGFAYLAHFPGVALEALGRLRGKLVAEMAAVALLAGGLLLSVRFGLLAAAYTILIVEMVRFAATHALLSGAFGIRPHRALWVFGPGAAGGVVTAAAGFAADSWFSFANPVAQLAAVTTCTVVALLPLLWHRSFRALGAELRARFTQAPATVSGSVPAAQQDGEVS